MVHTAMVPKPFRCADYLEWWSAEHTIFICIGIHGPPVVLVTDFGSHCPSAWRTWFVTDKGCLRAEDGNPEIRILEESLQIIPLIIG